MHKILIRICDIILSAAFLVAFFPFLLLIAIAVYFDMGSPVLFVQSRVGRKGVCFDMIKFRTMRQDVAVHGFEPINAYSVRIKDDPRITSLGNILRKTSLDETPQLVNVLTGSMSLVGPRPFVPEEYERFPKAWRARLDVLPGVTGLAQVNGRDFISRDQQVAYDMQWATNQSIFLYWKILASTVWCVVRRKHVL